MLEIMFASLDLSNNREEYRLLCVDVLLKKYVFKMHGLYFRCLLSEIIVLIKKKTIPF